MRKISTIKNIRYKGKSKNHLPPKSARKKLGNIASLASLIILISGCVVPSDGPVTDNQGDEEGSQPEENSEGQLTETESIADSLTTTTTLGSDLEISILALDRLENDLLKLSVRITNKSKDNFSLYNGLNEVGDDGTISQISLIDADNQKKHFSYDQSDGRCLCSPPEEISLSQGESTELWAAYPTPPLEVESMTVISPLSPPIFDVPISSSSENIENDGLLDEKIIDLTMISDSLEDHTGRTENEEEVSILLSSDVIFDRNSAELDPVSEDILEQVAEEIDAASSTIVKIDGHADNTGSDEINIPLSEERAESVESELSELVTRHGVTFESEGHGSADPIAENDTEEGQERNRRVSVTFEK